MLTLEEEVQIGREVDHSRQIGIRVIWDQALMTIEITISEEIRPLPTLFLRVRIRVAMTDSRDQVIISYHASLQTFLPIRYHLRTKNSNGFERKYIHKE